MFINDTTIYALLELFDHEFITTTVFSACSPCVNPFGNCFFELKTVLGEYFDLTFTYKSFAANVHYSPFTLY